MKGVTTFVTGTFFIAIVVLVGGALVDPLMAVIVSQDAVQSMGWVGHAEEIQLVVNKWAPLAGLVFFLAWAFFWAIRREKRTSSAFRRGR